MFILNTTGHNYVSQLKLKTTNIYRGCMTNKPSCRIQSAPKISEIDALMTMGRGITHDFNNLLTAIKGNTFIIKHSLAKDNKANESITQIENCTERALKLLNKLCIFTGRGALESQKTNINTVITSACKNLCQPHLTLPIIKFYLKDLLPEITADHYQLDNLIKCLITNSTEALIERDGCISITTGLIKKNDAVNIELTYPSKLEDTDYIFIRIEDNGKGIPVKIQKKMFTPFFTTKMRGEGLGLSIVLGVIRSHNGALIVNSKIHNGSSFTIMLPVQ